MNHMETVRMFIIENFLFGESDKLKDDTSFLESDIIDSTGILEVIAFLEETFGINVEDEELLPENFDTLINISSYLGNKLND